MEDVITDSVAAPDLLDRSEWLPESFKQQQAQTGVGLPPLFISSAHVSTGSALIVLQLIADITLGLMYDCAWLPWLLLFMIDFEECFYVTSQIMTCLQDSEQCILIVQLSGVLWTAILCSCLNVRWGQACMGMLHSDICVMQAPAKSDLIIEKHTAYASC